MKRFWTLLLICLVFSQAGCGKKPQSSAPAAEPEAAAPAELPVLEQNKVAPNPAAGGPQDVSFEPVSDELQHSPDENAGTPAD